jgi:ketosteroid isomerase-like protein
METKAPAPTATELAPADVVRAAYAAYNRGRLDEGMSYLAPDVEWVLPGASLHEQVLHGPAALKRVLESEFEAFSEIRREPVELEERGERVLGVISAFVRGRVSGIELELRTGHAFTVRDGLIVRAEPLLN